MFRNLAMPGEVKTDFGIKESLCYHFLRTGQIKGFLIRGTGHEIWQKAFLLPQHSRASGQTSQVRGRMSMVNPLKEMAPLTFAARAPKVLVPAKRLPTSMSSLNPNPPIVKTPLPELDSLIENGPIAGPQKFTIYGVDGIGKTTWASRFPSPLFIDGENGTRGFDVDRITASDSDSFHNAMRSLLKANDLKFKTIVFDTVEAVERFQREG